MAPSTNKGNAATVSAGKSSQNGSSTTASTTASSTTASSSSSSSSSSTNPQEVTWTRDAQGVAPGGNTWFADYVRGSKWSPSRKQDRVGPPPMPAGVALEDAIPPERRNVVWPPFNPFTYPLPPTWGKLLSVLCGVVLVPIRLTLIIIVMCTFAAYLSLWGARGGQVRKSTPLLMRIVARTLLFLAGFFWIPETRIGPESTPNGPVPAVVVSNHLGYCDILYMIARFGCCFVAKAGVAKLPVAGTIASALQCIFVDRESGNSQTSNIILQRTAGNSSKRYPMLCMFPEGTTTNNRSIIHFRTGAFISGQPVQPMTVRSHASWFGVQPCFTCFSMLKHLLLVLSQPVNFLSANRLPVYAPNADERADPALFAARVRQLISVTVQLPTYELEWRDKLPFEPPKKRETSLAAIRAAHSPATDRKSK